LPNNRPIGIFDSGVGGLTVLKEIKRLMPQEDIIYLGDTARVPYGTRSEETVKRYAFECVDFLLSRDVKVLVIACNTASAIALEDIKRVVTIPTVGVIEPGAVAAVGITKNRKVGVIGTEGTIRSLAYDRAIRAIDASVSVASAACPLFVPLVEEGWADTIVAELTAGIYLGGFREIGIDTLVLGCTHYPLLKRVIQKVMGPEVNLVDSAIETAKAVRAILEQGGLFREGQGGALKVNVTDSIDRFRAVGERFLKAEIDYIDKVALNKNWRSNEN
jgi:glutamate racemase